MMKGLAIYSLLALTGFAIFAIYFAVAGDNSPLWLTIFLVCLPAIAFACLYLAGKR